MTPIEWVHLVDLLLAALVVISALGVFWQRNLVAAVVFGGVSSLVTSLLFLRMAAPDVAMTEAAIGAGLSTVIFLIAVRRTRETEQEDES